MPLILRSQANRQHSRPHIPPFQDIESVQDACQWMADTMEFGATLEWPLYQGELGEDSTGGTHRQTYAELNRAGILTLNSQDGHCDTEWEPAHPAFVAQQIKIGFLPPNAQVVGVKERQASALDCFMDTSLAISVFQDIDLTKVDCYIWAHANLVDGLMYQVKDNDRLVQSSPKNWTTHIFKFADGSERELPGPIGSERRSHRSQGSVSTRLTDVLAPRKKYYSIRDIASAFAVDNAHPALIQNLLTGDFVGCTFVMREPCTLPHTAAMAVLDLLLANG